MITSTLTDKGQTTVPLEIRKALKIRARQQLTWSIANDGSAVVRPRSSPLVLFGSLKSPQKFTSRGDERRATAAAMGNLAAREALT